MANYESVLARNSSYSNLFNLTIDTVILSPSDKNYCNSFMCSMPDCTQVDFVTTIRNTIPTARDGRDRNWLR